VVQRSNKWFLVDGPRNNAFLQRELDEDDLMLLWGSGRALERGYNHLRATHSLIPFRYKCESKIERPSAFQSPRVRAAH
jgi:hypothetical protein